MVARNARLPHLCQNRVYYPLNRESGVLARTHCHYILTPLYHFSYYRAFEFGSIYSPRVESSMCFS